MKNISIKIILIFSSLTLQSVSSQPLSDYYSRNDFLMAPASTFMNGLVGFSNPANLALLKSFESRLAWASEGNRPESVRDWGLFSGIKGLGFSMLSQKIHDLRVMDYRMSIGLGTQELAFGAGYGWSSGNRGGSGREKMLSTGVIYRPFKYLSLGGIGNFSIESESMTGVIEFGIRPSGTPRLTFFTDLVLQQRTRFSSTPWSAGAAVQVATGINCVGRIFNSRAFTIGVLFNFGKQGIATTSCFDSEKKLVHYQHMLRWGDMQPTLYHTIFEKNKKYLALNLTGRVDYHKFVLFDDKTHRLMDLLQNIHAAAKDTRIAVIVLNLSTMQVLPEHAWEIREALKTAQKAGKKVIIFLDTARMTTYHLASVADKIVMEPEGQLRLQGLVMGRTYFKGALEKLGLAFDEWRLFKYKSAAEVLSRDNMSEPDREQYQDYLDDWYNLVRSDVCDSRNLLLHQFDNFINEKVFFFAREALQAGLVDTLGRWSSMEKIMENYTGKDLEMLAVKDLMTRALPQQTWGKLPAIAVVYGLGVCELDRGIKARWLEQVFLNLKDDKSVKAVVFRVDSPGGDGMASDLVAEAVKMCSRDKPVIVSQGQVAGSGGYWLSMYGDSIVAGPNTVTGSIGVIGGWVYDNGLSDNMGLSSDQVKRGAHADLGYGVTLPLLGLQVPARNLTDEERDKVIAIIQNLYDTFVAKVALGRNLPIARVKDIAEGHFYSGIEGKELGLVDKVGGLLTALAIAQQQAGLQPDARVNIIEIPRDKGLFNFPSSLDLIETDGTGTAVWPYLRLFCKQPGQPLPMMVPGTWPTLD